MLLPLKADTTLEVVGLLTMRSGGNRGAKVKSAKGSVVDMLGEAEASVYSKLYEVI